MKSDPQIFKQIQQVVPCLNQCQLIGISVEAANKGQLLLKLPYSDIIIGDPETGVIHGGALTTLMDTACGFAAIAALDEPGICPTLDLRIDYMRPAEPKRDVLGFAEAYRVTKSVIFARGIAYHKGDKDKPIAHCTATFMRLDPNRIENNDRIEKVLP